MSPRPATSAAFRTVSGGGPLRVVLVGAGAMGRAWLRTLVASDQVTVAGVVDLDGELARRAVAEDAAGSDAEPGTSLGEIAARTGAEAVVNVTVPAAHLPVTLEALDLGLPVLGEKPLAADLAEAVTLVAAAETAGELFMVSQSRRYDRRLWTLRAHAARLGGIGILTQEFFKAPRFGGFRDAMDHPLILDMAIHNFDAARFVLDAAPTAVYCEEYNPPWSWYQGDAASTALFEMDGGTRFVYSGSWCSDGLETSWNSRWRVSGARGSALWDGDGEPVLEFAERAADTGPASPDAPPAPDAPSSPDAPPAEGIAGSLAEFVHALRTGRTPMGECHDNLLSLAMVHAAIASSRARTRVELAEVLGAARVRSTGR